MSGGIEEMEAGKTRLDTPPPQPQLVVPLRWLESPFDAYQHFTDTDGTPYLIEFGRGSWRLTHGDRSLGNLVSLKAAKQAAEEDAAALATATSEGSTDGN